MCKPNRVGSPAFALQGEGTILRFPPLPAELAPKANPRRAAIPVPKKSCGRSPMHQQVPQFVDVVEVLRQQLLRCYGNPAAQRERGRLAGRAVVEGGPDGLRVQHVPQQRLEQGRRLEVRDSWAQQPEEVRHQRGVDEEHLEEASASLRPHLLTQGSSGGRGIRRVRHRFAFPEHLAHMRHRDVRWSCRTSHARQTLVSDNRTHHV